MAVQDWSSTAASNTSVGGLTTDGNIQVVSNIDAMFRGMMADIRTGIDEGYFDNPGYDTKTGNYTAVVADRAKLFHFTSAATLSLTAAATLGAGWTLFVRARGGAVTVDPSGAELINGVATLVIPDGHSMLIMCTGTVFRTFADSSGGHLVNARLISVNSTYTPGASIKSVVIEIIGGGGSGGAASSNAANQAGAGSGGGAGGYVRKLITSPAAATITIGGGGAAAVASGGTSTAGNNGGTSIYADGTNTLTAGGGSGGNVLGGSQYLAVVSGAGGGTATGGDINIVGQSSTHAISSGTTMSGGVNASASASQGASTIYGAAGQGGTISTVAVGTQSNGTGALGFGSGGGGSARACSVSGGSTSGAGSQGICLIWEYV